MSFYSTYCFIKSQRHKNTIVLLYLRQIRDLVHNPIFVYLYLCMNFKRSRNEERARETLLNWALSERLRLKVKRATSPPHATPLRCTWCVQSGALMRAMQQQRYNRAHGYTKRLWNAREGEERIRTSRFAGEPRKVARLIYAPDKKHEPRRDAATIIFLIHSVAHD